MSKKTKIVAVTGGIGSGQSTVSRALEVDFGCKVINADRLAKQIIDTNSDVKEMLAEAFGKAIFDKNGILKRREFAATVFVDKNQIQRLNTIVHPYLVAELITEIEDAQEAGNYPLIVIDAALIYEMAIEKFFDFVVVVYAKKDVRVQRVIKRDGLSRAEILHRMENQFDLNDKRSWADFIIENNEGFNELKTEVASLYKKIVAAKIN